MDLEAVAASAQVGTGVQIGLAVTVFLAGLRHGFDLDHIAAITDISSSAANRRRSLVLGTFYIVGHALVLVILGTLAVLAGQRIPASLDSLMGRVIGFTLIVLGLYVVYSLIRFRRDFRPRSRWMLVVAGIKRSAAWLRRPRLERIEIEHEHPHDASGHHHRDAAPAQELSTGWGGSDQVVVKTETHAHPHKHVVEVPVDPFKEYGAGTCLGIGMIHGVGAETPSQMLLFTSAAGVTSALGGMFLVVAFVAGLMAGNTVLAVASAAGYSQGKRLPVVYMILAGLTAVMSIALGSLYLVDRADLLPSFLGG